MNCRNSIPIHESEEERIFRIERRINEKIDDYEEYSFSSVQDCALKTFFDLCQEFDNQRDFYCVCVLIPKIFYDLESALYLVNENGIPVPVCHSEDLYSDPPQTAQDAPPLFETPCLHNDSFVVPIKGNERLLASLPKAPDKGIFGLFEIHSASWLSWHMKLFFEKYVNRIGFQLHNRLILQKNREHIRFIQNLVSDIGHNVIVPNMYYKVYFRRLKGKIDRVREIGKELRSKLEIGSEMCHHPVMNQMIYLQDELEYVNEAMDEQFEQILTHYEHTSLFLETLLRRSHFEQGRYVLESSRTNFKERIIRPQLNRYLPRLASRNIEVDDRLGGIPDEEITVVADIGLISQVYANLFSNAMKYTREVYDDQGRAHKFIALGMEVLMNYFGGGKDGIKFNLFSTGPHIPPSDVEHLFEEGYRGENAAEEYGTGHGLIFIKEVIELHGGVVGYESTPMGNNFFFILPRPEHRKPVSEEAS